MIEPIMYMGIGLLAGCLIGLIAVHPVHNRAVRLTVRRLESALPQSFAEIQADKDVLRAEFAMAVRRLEIIIEQLKDKTVSQRVELGRKGDLINRLKVERDGLKFEVVSLSAQVEALKRWLDALDKGAKPKVQVGSFIRQWVPHRIHH
jgi:hypothetical protein